MNTGGNTRRFLPEINSNKQRRDAQRRMKVGSLQTASVLDKSAQILSREEIAQCRNSLKQNICVETLQEGYHRSFSELFSLLRRDQDQRATAEPGTDVLFQSPLEEQRDKLETMKLHLSLAEKAERTGSWSMVHEQRLFLGRYFSAPEDLWLSKHFYLSCTERQQGSRSRPATEARACLAELYLHQDDVIVCLCVQFFNTYMQICGTLEDPDGLGKAYKAMANEGNIDETVRCLEQLADISLSNGLQRSLADAHLCLGKIYFTSRQYERASQYFLQSYEVTCNLGDMALLQEVQVWVGSARAHSFIRKYSADVVSETPAALRRLLVWKETRGGQDLSTDSTDYTAATCCSTSDKDTVL
eukprot:superscaffoldBa00003249_g16474